LEKFKRYYLRIFITVKEPHKRKEKSEVDTGELDGPTKQKKDPEPLSPPGATGRTVKAQRG